MLLPQSMTLFLFLPLYRLHEVELKLTQVLIKILRNSFRQSFGVGCGEVFATILYVFLSVIEEWVYKCFYRNQLGLRGWDKCGFGGNFVQACDGKWRRCEEVKMHALKGWYGWPWLCCSTYGWWYDMVMLLCSMFHKSNWFSLFLFIVCNVCMEYGCHESMWMWLCMLKDDKKLVCPFAASKKFLTLFYYFFIF